MIYDIKNISFRYYPNQKTILKDVSFTIEKGQILSILGPNGAGKSTLLNCMKNLITPFIGEILLCGKNIKKMSMKEIAGLVGYVPQNHNPSFGFKVFDFVLMGRAPVIKAYNRPGLKDMEAAWSALESLNITYLSDKPYTEISGGEMQQALIARSIVCKPKVLLFDEPTAHLDYGNQINVLRLIKKLSKDGYSIVITTHNPDHAMLLGGSAAVLDKDGHMRTGSTSAILKENLLNEVYNTDLKIIDIPELSRSACIPAKL
ncbi:MAG: ABC transporter ATP-binding protein [Clostridiales bacterium]|nr:ABC transporter ATP-binding protein [Clostridiales bacterium]